MASLRAHLLIAAPQLIDPNFHRSVVMVAEHSEEGALGLVLNRPTDVVAADAAPELAELTEPGDVVYAGGPVGASSVIVLADFADPDEAALIVHGSVGFVAAGSEPDWSELSIRRARVFAGHSGWGPRQLEAELEREDWIVEPMRGDELFAPHAEDLWGDVLGRKGGQYALVARMPDDPSQN